VADYRIAIVGFGKIARDQHVPAIAGNEHFELAAVVQPGGAPDAGVPVFEDVAAMIAATRIDAVSICTPPGPRHDIARTCIEAGLNVLLEKPPAATLGEIADIRALAQAKGTTLFSAWHSQHNEAVERAATITHAEGIASLAIEWMEDVEKWHPGQDWIWQAGGFGVFDPGINALSIASLLSPETLVVKAAELTMQQQQPAQAKLTLDAEGATGAMTALFDFHHKEGEHWTMDIVTHAGTKLALSEGGAVLRIGDAAPFRGATGEYPALYADFAGLIAGRQSRVDAEPLRIVADAFLLAHRD
jgi:D-galactose 1-dehydrogenase